MNWLIIAAGGNGERMNLGYNKIFAKLNKKPILYWNLKIFNENELIDKIIISAKAYDIRKIEKIVKKYRFKKVIKVIEAGGTRQESTFKVLQWIKESSTDNDLIGVHNGVNIFVKKSEIEEVYKKAKEHGAALLAIKAKDTVKITEDDGFVKNTPLRKYCWYAQTPQVALFKHMFLAFSKADEEKFQGTDDTQLLERINIKPKIVPCSNLNFKITFNEDLIVARKIIKDFKTNK